MGDQFRPGAGLLAHRPSLGTVVTVLGCLHAGWGRLHQTDGNLPAAPPAGTCRHRASYGRSTCRRSHATPWSRWCLPRPPRRRRRFAWRRPRTGTGWRRSGQRPARRGQSVVRSAAKGRGAVGAAGCGRLPVERIGLECSRGLGHRSGRADDQGRNRQRCGRLAHVVLRCAMREQRSYACPHRPSITFSAPTWQRLRSKGRSNPRILARILLPSASCRSVPQPEAPAPCLTCSAPIRSRA